MESFGKGSLREFQVSLSGRTDASGSIESIDPLEDPKGPSGLHLLYAGENPLVDFIFVHGLGGGSRKTWAFSSNSDHYWPKEWLSKEPEFQSTRIHSFGYKADWMERGESLLNILDFARSLLSEILNSPEIRKSNTKLVFVAHSMGGIVVKKMYVLARQDPELGAFASRIHTLYFLATPHRGSEFAKTLVKILRVSYSHKQYLSDLKLNSESVSSTNESFRHIAHALHLWSFYETLPTSLFFKSAVIVDKISATLGYPKEKIAPLMADHRGVCKFNTPTDHNYKVLRNSFTATIDLILSEISQATSENLEIRQSQLSDLMSLGEISINDLSALDEVRVPGSCEWLMTNSQYQSWRQTETSNFQTFWLSGDAGCGKSVLTSQVVHNLQKSRLPCSYFFFQHGNATKSTGASLLKALVWQMARNDDQILNAVLRFQQVGLLWDQLEERAIWNKIFLDCIFKISSKTTQFWVIDSLDECQRPSTLLALFKQLPSQIKLFFTSRESPEIGKGVSLAQMRVTRYCIRRQDTLGDIAIFLDSRIDQFPTSDADDQKLQVETLKQKILDKAAGSFLWVSLVTNELEQAYSEEAVEEILEEVPTNMNQVYSRMLENVIKNARSVVIAKSIFTWVLLAFRPLTTEELRLSIKLNINQTVPNLSKYIQTICGQMVYINQQGETEIIHQTAKAYLLQQQAWSGLAIRKKQDHTQMAQVCLEILSADAIRRSTFSMPVDKAAKVFSSSELLEYASEYFSDHLHRCTSEDKNVWQLLCKFLKSNLLHWIHYLAVRKKLSVLTHAAKNMQFYARRRAKYMGPYTHEILDLDDWVYDLIRLHAKFGNYLSTSASSVFKILPAMCPSKSITSRTYASRHPGLTMRGKVDAEWDDCSVRVDYPDHVQTTAVAHGDRYAAVALSDRTIAIYDHDADDLEPTILRTQRVNLLVFSTGDRYMATSSHHNVEVWRPIPAEKLWTFDALSVMALIFSEQNQVLVAATKKNSLISWDLISGNEIERWDWTESIHRNATIQPPAQQPSKATFSPDFTKLAVCYRGFPIFLFTMDFREYIGCCSRTGSITRNYDIDALAFSPNTESHLLIVSYGDGELVTYDSETTKRLSSYVDVFAHCLACSPDGQFLVTGSSRGTIQIFEIGGARGQMISVIYRINAYEDGIRGITFGLDNHRFADIRGSQYRIWDPAVLLVSDMDESSQSDMSEAVPIEPKLVGMLEGPAEAELTTVCPHPNGRHIFCGKQNGHIDIYETSLGTQSGTLYQHKAGITCMIYIQDLGVLIAADESGLVTVSKVQEQTIGYLATTLAVIRVNGSPLSLVPHHSGSKFLIKTKRSLEVWTLEAEQVGKAIELEGHGVESFTHPLNPDQFLLIGGGGNTGITSYSWIDAEITQRQRTDTGPNDPSASLPISMRHSSLTESHPLDLESQTVVYFTRNISDPPSVSTVNSKSRFQIWSANPAENGPHHEELQALDLSHYAPKIRQIICTAGSLLIFLDSHFWVCSLDLRRMTSEPVDGGLRLTLLMRQSAKRHFYLLSEWQSSYGGFLVEYVAQTREFIVARKDGILILQRALELEDYWI